MIKNFSLDVQFFHFPPKSSKIIVKKIHPCRDMINEAIPGHTADSDEHWYSPGTNMIRTKLIIHIYQLQLN